MAYLSRLMGAFVTLLRSSSLNRPHHTLDWARICSHLFSNMSLFVFMMYLLQRCAWEYEWIARWVGGIRFLSCQIYGSGRFVLRQLEARPGWKSLLDDCGNLEVR